MRFTVGVKSEGVQRRGVGVYPADETPGPFLSYSHSRESEEVLANVCSNRQIPLCSQECDLHVVSLWLQDSDEFSTALRSNSDSDPHQVTEMGRVCLHRPWCEGCVESAANAVVHPTRGIIV